VTQAEPEHCCPVESESEMYQVTDKNSKNKEAEALCSKLAEHERNELLDQLVETMEKISENWEQYKMEEHDAVYPFAESFDELTLKVSNWRDSILGLRQ
jgi:biotin-(acetyl-CoA carboxylase) ligase